MQQRAIDRATQLIISISGGDAGPITESSHYDYLPQRSPVTLRRYRIEKILGIRIEDEEVEAIFNGLGMQTEAWADGWKVTPPGYRFDIAIEADLLEEIGRIYGYNNLPNNRLLMRSELGKAPESVLSQERAKDLLVDQGYQEAITYSFVDEVIQKALAPEDEFIRLQNPLSSELSVMRTTLWCGLLNAAVYNAKRQQNRVRLFESGLRFIKKNGNILQQPMLSGLAMGDVNNEQWGEKSRKVDFFDVKADLEALFSLTGHRITYVPKPHFALHPGQSAQLLDVHGESFGWLGMLHPTLEKQLGFDAQVFLFELEWDKLLEKHVPVFKPLSRFPSVKRDLAIIVEDKIPAAEIIACIENCHEQTIRSIRIFDVYRGPGVEEGYKSIALSLNFQDYSQTLTDSEIDAIFTGVLQALMTELGARLRD